MKQKKGLFYTLIYKDYKLQLRAKKSTAFIILIPTLFAILSLVLRYLIESNHKTAVIYPPFDCTKVNLQYSEIAYSPNNSQVKYIMERVGEQIKLKTSQFASAKQVENYLRLREDRKLGVVFDDSLGLTSELPDKINFDIRFPNELASYQNTLEIEENWMTTRLFPAIEFTGPRKPRNISFQTAGPPYNEEGFLKIQYYISHNIIEMYKNNSSKPLNIPDIQMQRYPYPDYVDDPLLAALIPITALMMIYSYIYPQIYMIRVIIAEKEMQLTEMMKIMGLKNSMLWSTRFLTTFLFMTISTTIIVLILKFGKVYMQCDGLIMFIFLETYCCCIIVQGFLISTFFNKANTALLITLVLCYVTYLPYQQTSKIYLDLSLTPKLAMSLFPNSAMGYGFYLMGSFEATGEGLHWKTLFDTYTPDDNLTFAYVYLMLVFDTFLYLLLAIYFDAIWPSKYGVQKRWDYIFDCFKKKSVKVTAKPLKEVSDTIIDYTKFESEPVDLTVGIDITGLTRTFGDKVAVRNVSLRMFEDQITVLLGHNGAGKTTTMSMLTGMYPPTSGTAIMNGFDISHDLQEVRESLGLCPQHNILFDDMTVSEHIIFYCRLKGMDKADAHDEVESLLKDFALTDYANVRSRNLSGGYKRKLCMALAFCADSKIVILDEPTAGMDPAARRVMWAAIESRKKGRVILLTTHFMDEADILGDRIAIMSAGEVLCCGSSFFLKKAYGTGYQLKIEKEAGCDADKITDALANHIPTISIHSHVGTELTYVLHEDQVDVFQQMLGDLETHSSELKVASFGISLTKLEEVFMRIGKPEHEITTEFTKNGTVQRDKLTSGYKLMLNHFRAMLYKRYYYTIRSWLLYASQFLLACVVIVATLAQHDEYHGDPPSMKISLDKYNSPVTVVSRDDATNPFYTAGRDWLKYNHKTIRDIGDKNMTNEMLTITKNHEATVRMRYMVGATFTEGSVTSWFNNQPYHTPPLALNLVMNSILRSFKPDSEIILSNHPLPPTLDPKGKFKEAGPSNLVFAIPMIISFIGGFTITFYIKERSCKAKHLQYTSGVNILVFWATTYLWDWIIYLITVLGVVATLLCFQTGGYKTGADMARLLFIFVLIGFELLPILYLLSRFFASPSKGFLATFGLLYFLGQFTFTILMVVMLAIGDITATLENILEVISGILMCVPSFFTIRSVSYMEQEFNRVKLCRELANICSLTQSEDFCWSFLCLKSSKCCVRDTEYFRYERPGIQRDVTFVLIYGLLYHVLLLCIELDVITWIKNRFAGKMQLNMSDADDDDVQAENNRIRSMSYTEVVHQSLVLKDVRKTYSGGKQAVVGVNLGVGREECFGLLGVNGAGKTTTFKMITGDLHMTSGEIYVCGFNTKRDIKQIRKRTGYCPQFDAMFDTFTAKETLVMFALIRGYLWQDCADIAWQVALQFDFHKHFNTRVGNMSGGNKRKLSTALAFLGDPDIVFLDEPTAGMDPVAKRYIWSILSKARADGKCLILTSHSMEECEALCTRLAIMVNGSLKCIGAIQHLTNKFSQGYTLTIKTARRVVNVKEDIEKVLQYIMSRIPSAVLKERQSEYLSFHIVDRSVPCSELFGIMQRAKLDVNIDDYSLSQSSLEQVFLSFTS